MGLLSLLLFEVSAISTEAQSAEIWRLQITFVTANVSDAGTDDDISVSLNRNNLTWLDYGRDDFERNRTHTYDLLQNGNLRTLGDITRIQIRKNGSDGWCIREFTVSVNAGDYRHTTRFDSCRWLDNDNGHSRDYTINNPRFTFGGLVTIPAAYLERSEVESLLESAIGHRLIDSPLYWDNDDGRVVSVSHRSPDVLRVDLDLRYALNNSTDPSVDVDYDIRFRCNGGTLAFNIENIEVNVGFSIGTSTVIITSDPLIPFSGERLRNSIARLNDASCNVRVLEGGTISVR
jgi:hypothetical protein